ncbi:class II aldolase/adducin family protein [Bradyrhizobium sp. USDA 4486]
MSARVGSNMLLVQGAAIHPSSTATCSVKASGTWLADAEAKDIFVPVCLSAARAALAQGDERVPLAPHAAKTLRASIETALHALMPHPVVLHVHSVNTIAWAVRTDARDELGKRLDGLAWRRLDYFHHGLPLAHAVSNVTALNPIDVLILCNHGLVVGAANCDAAEALVHEVERRLSLPPRRPSAADDQALRSICSGTNYRLPADPLCHNIATDRFSRAIATSGSLYPDHVVFLGPGLPILAEGQDLATMTMHASAVGLSPPVSTLIPGIGAVIREDASPGAEAMLTCLALMTCRLPLSAEISYLSIENEQALLNWDAERYRRQLTANR